MHSCSANRLRRTQLFTVPKWHLQPAGQFAVAHAMDIGQHHDIAARAVDTLQCICAAPMVSGIRVTVASQSISSALSSDAS